MGLDISITIVAYKNYSDIRGALESIQRHTNQKLNKVIYIVDNGRSDSDAQDVNDFMDFISKMPEVKYIDVSANIGFGKGHNYVLPEIDSKYHAIINPDVILVEDVFSKIIEWMDQNTSVGMVIPRIVDEENRIQPIYRRELTVLDIIIRFLIPFGFRNRRAKHTMQDMNYDEPFHVMFGQGSFLVIRTNLFKELSGFDPNFFMYVEDADFCKRVNQVSRLYYLPYATVIHKWQKGSHKNIVLLKYHIQSLIYYFNKWGWKMM